MQSRGRVIYFTPPLKTRWEEKARQVRHDYFSLETTCFPYVLIQDVRPRYFLQGILMGTTSWPLFNGCAISLQWSTQDSLPLFSFKQQTSTCGLEGFLVVFCGFFSPPPSQLRKPTCVSYHMLKLDTKKGVIHHSSRPPIFTKTFKESLKEP